MKASLNLPPGTIRPATGPVHHAVFGMRGAGQLFAFDHAHEQFHRLEVEHFGDVVANDAFGAAAGGAMPLGGGHRNDFLHARQMGGQRRPAMRQGGPGKFLFPRRQRGFGGDFLAGHARFQIQQRQLRVGKLFGLGPVLFQPQEPERLFQQLDFNRQPGAFRLGFGLEFFAFDTEFLRFIPLAEDALEHRAKRFGKRVQIGRGDHV